MENPAPVPIWLGQRGGREPLLVAQPKSSPKRRACLLLPPQRIGSKQTGLTHVLAWENPSSASWGSGWWEGLQRTIFLSGRTQLHALQQAYCLINETTRGDLSRQIGGNLAPSGQGRISSTDSTTRSLSLSWTPSRWKALLKGGYLSLVRMGIIWRIFSPEN